MDSMKQEIIFRLHISDDMLRKYSLPKRFELGCFIIVLKGSCKLSINLMEHEVKARSIITILPHSIVSVISRSEDYECNLIICTPGFSKDLESVSTILSRVPIIERNPVLNINDDECEFTDEFVDLFNRMYHKCEQKGKLGTGLITHLLLSFFYGLCAIYDRKIPGAEYVHIKRKEEIATNFLSLVFTHYSKERNVSYYANKLCITPKYLNSVIREIRGLSASRIIANAVIMEAKSRLKCSTNTVQQIAYDLNFPNQSFFTKYFKRYVGMTPTQYIDS